MKVISVIFLILFSMVAQAKTIDRIVAVVNNEAITEYELDRAISVRRPQMPRDNNPEPNLKQLHLKILNDLINEKLLEQEADKTDIEVTDDELARAVANILQKNKIAIENLQASLAAQGVSFEEYKIQLKRQILQAKLIQQNAGSQVQITDQDVQKYRTSLKKVKPLDQNISVHLAVLIKQVDPDASSNDIREEVRKTRKITDKARRGEDFATLIREYSEDPKVKEEGGDWGTMLISSLPGPIASYVRKMKIGSVSDPILMPDGIYIVKLLEKSVVDETGQQDEATLRQQLYNERMEQAVNGYLMKLRRKAFVDIREPV